MVGVKDCCRSPNNAFNFLFLRSRCHGEKSLDGLVLGLSVGHRNQNLLYPCDFDGERLIDVVSVNRRGGDLRLLTKVALDLVEAVRLVGAKRLVGTERR